MPSWRWQIEVYTSTDGWENLIDILNKEKTRTQNLAIMEVCPAEIVANGWSNTVD